MREDDFLLIGKVIGAHGIKGAVKIVSYAEAMDVFQPGDTILVKPVQSTAQAYKITWSQPHKKIVRLALQAISDRTEAEALIGATLFINKAALPELEADTYYWFDLIGVAVVTVHGRVLGKIEEIIPTGSNDVYVVRNRSLQPTKEILVPAIATVVQQTDITDKIMVVNLPEGLE